MTQIYNLKCISNYFSQYRLVNSKVVSFSGMMIAVTLFLASGHIGNQQVFAFGGHGFSHGYSTRYNYGPGYPIFPCGSGPYSITNGQTVCIPAQTQRKLCQPTSNQNVNYTKISSLPSIDQVLNERIKINLKNSRLNVSSTSA